MAFPPCPSSLKPIMHYLKIAQEHDSRNVVVSYWSRLHALQVGLGLSAGQKSHEETALLAALMDWLEAQKKALHDNEAIANEVCAQAAIEEYVLKLFKFADEQDRAENFNKNLVKAFYTCGIIMDVLAVFGDLSDDIAEKQKYAKWKAAYIHSCLKEGKRPIPGPMQEEDSNEFGIPSSEPSGSDPSYSTMPNMGFNAPAAPQAPSSSDTTFYKPPPVTPPAVTEVNRYPVEPPANPTPPAVSSVPSNDSENLPVLPPELIAKAQKYCKYAGSALNYDDTKTAISNLTKALNLLQTGKDS